MAAASHCCVCHRFDAGHIEVHHIRPQAEGGSDEFENAIALCFDCHTWAGHYNSKHPKGFRFSPEFLQAAKKSWYEVVAAGLIPVAPENSIVQVRYLISRDHSVTTRILDGDLSLSPFKDAMLANNAFGKAYAAFLRLRPDGFRTFSGDSYPSKAEYLASHCGAISRNADMDGFPYYDFLRRCDRDELAHRLSEDKFTQLLSNQGVDASELCVVVANNYECGGADETIFETYLTRPLWGVFLALTNVSDARISFAELFGQLDISEGYRKLESNRKDFSFQMPACEISAAQTVLVPIAMLLAPIEELGEEQIQVQSFGKVGDSIEVMNLTEFSTANLGQFRLIGPSFWPKDIRMMRGGAPTIQAVHAFTTDSAYTLDRVWLCGSCPHLFVLDGNGTARYIGELIPQGERKEVTHIVEIPFGVTDLIIAELEDEESTLSEVSVDGTVVFTSAKMRKGDMLRISVSSARSLCVKGAYFPLYTKFGARHGPETRNRLICQFLSRIKPISSSCISD